VNQAPYLYGTDRHNHQVINISAGTWTVHLCFANELQAYSLLTAGIFPVNFRHNPVKIHIFPVNCNLFKGDHSNPTSSHLHFYQYLNWDKLNMKLLFFFQHRRWFISCFHFIFANTKASNLFCIHPIMYYFNKYIIILLITFLQFVQASRWAMEQLPGRVGTLSVSEPDNSWLIPTELLSAPT